MSQSPADTAKVKNTPATAAKAAAPPNTGATAPPPTGNTPHPTPAPATGNTPAASTDEKESREGMTRNPLAPFMPQIFQLVIGPAVAKVAGLKNYESKKALHEAFIAQFYANNETQCAVSMSTFSEWLNVLGYRIEQTARLVKEPAAPAVQK